MKTKKIAYIAHPIGGDARENTLRVIAIVRHINKTQPDVIPFAPYVVDLLALDDDNEDERKRGMANGAEILRTAKVDEVWLYGEKISAGMKAEIAIADRRSIPVKPKTRATDMAFYQQKKPATT